LGVESHIIDNRTRLYVVNSVEELDSIPAPDYASGIAYYSGGKVFLVERAYDREPTEREVRDDYVVFDQAVTPELRIYGAGFKDTILRPSHPEYNLPDYMLAKYDKAPVSKNTVVDDKKPFKLCSLLWLLLVSEQ
jgi:hypothetical protein